MPLSPDLVTSVLQAAGLTVHRVMPRPNHPDHLVVFLEGDGRAEQATFAAVKLPGVGPGDVSFSSTTSSIMFLQAG